MTACGSVEKGRVLENPGMVRDLATQGCVCFQTFSKRRDCLPESELYFLLLVFYSIPRSRCAWVLDSIARTVLIYRMAVVGFMLVLVLYACNIFYGFDMFLGGI